VVYLIGGSIDFTTEEENQMEMLAQELTVIAELVSKRIGKFSFLQQKMD